MQSRMAFITSLPVTASFRARSFTTHSVQSRPSLFLTTRTPRRARLSTHSAVRLQPTTCSAKSGTTATALDVMRLALPERKSLLLGVIASLASSSILLLTPTLFGRVLDIVSSFHVTGPTEGIKLLSRSALRLQGVYVIGAALQLVEVALMRIAGERIVASLRSRVFSNIVRADVATLDKSSTGELMSRLSSDTTVLQRVMTTDVVKLLQGGLETAVACIMMFILCRKLAMVVYITVPLCIAAGVLYGNRTATLAKEVSTSFARASQVANEQLNGIKIVKSFARESYAEKAYNDKVRQTLELGRRSAWADGVLHGWNRLVFTMNTCVILLFGGRLVAAGKLTVGAMMAFVLYMSNVTAALGKLSSGIGEVIRASGAVDRILNILSTKPRIEGRLSKKYADVGYGVDLEHEHTENERGSVKFRDVSFKYPGVDRKILKKISFDIPAGGSAAFVGSSGAGKSTALALLSRFYDPHEGEILLDGQSLKEYNLMDLRQNLVGIVSQEPYIITGSLADNIAFGRQGATRKDIETAAEAAGVMEFAKKLPHGLDTFVTNLSGGEKQRLMIARCLAKQPVIMVLDEPTSALDRASEALVNETIERLIRDTERTVILISHRLSTVKYCDQILVFDGGEIVEQGSHDHLLEMNGAYCRLLNAVR